MPSDLKKCTQSSLKVLEDEVPVQVRRESIGSAIKDSSLSLAGTLVPLAVQVLPAGTPE